MKKAFTLVESNKKIAKAKRAPLLDSYTSEVFEDIIHLKVEGINTHKHGEKHTVTDTDPMQVFVQKHNRKSEYYF